MKSSTFFSLVLALAVGAPAQTRPPAPPAAPANFQNETLNYSVNWPSGLSLGEAHMQASRTGDAWDFRMSLDAALPGYAISDRFRSKASAADFSAIELEKHVSHGKKKGDERTVFDAQKGIATRETLNGGGKTEIPITPGPRDALAFMYYLRRELSQGRLPSAQTVYFGAPYQVHLEYGGAQTIQSGGAATPTDRIVVSAKGPASQNTFEFFISRDPARTPVLIRVPAALGTFSLELVR